MCRHILRALFLILFGLAFVACDEETVAPLEDEPPAQLLEGAWTLRVSPDPDLYDPFLISGTFSTIEDTVFFDTAQGVFEGDVAGRGVRGLGLSWEDGSLSWPMTLSIGVARDGATLTGTFETAMKRGEPITGTVFGAPGDDPPEIAVRLTPAHTTMPLEASLNMISLVTGYPDRSVTWSQEPAGVGTLTSSGRYTAPAYAPEPTVVMIMAASTVDIGARDTATVLIEVPDGPDTPDCQYVQGLWEIRFLIEQEDGFSEDHYSINNWNIFQEDCGLILYDVGPFAALEMVGGHAYGYQYQCIYNLYFENGDEIVAPSTIEMVGLVHPWQSRVQPIRGVRWTGP